MEEMSRSLEFQIDGQIETLFKRAEKHHVSITGGMNVPFIAHITVHDKELRVVDGKILTVKITRQLTAEPSGQDPMLYYISDKVSGKFRSQFRLK